MNVTAQRLRSVGWIAMLLVCASLVMVLAFRVNALRSQVHQSDMRIVALKQETMYLETEFETRANQQQLKAWNDVEFGYVAPGAAQFLDNERQLAAYAKPVEPGAPAPIRVASADDSVVAAAAFPAMVSPLSGRPLGEEDGAKADRSKPDGADDHPARSTAHSPAHRTTASADDADRPARKARAPQSLGERLATLRDDDAPTPRHSERHADKPAKPATAARKADKTHGDSGHAGAVARHDGAAKKAVAAAPARAAGKKPAHKDGGTIRLALRDAKTVK